jgi:hypothetical protein
MQAKTQGQTKETPTPASKPDHAHAAAFSTAQASASAAPSPTPATDILQRAIQAVEALDINDGLSELEESAQRLKVDD